MASYDQIIKGFQRDIEQLQDTVDDRNISLQVIENEKQEILEPIVLASQISCTVMEMLNEVMDFIKTKGESEKVLISKRRLLDLLYKTEKLNTIAGTLNSLKITNRNLHAKYQLLRIENMKLTEQLKRTQDAINY